VATDSDGLPRTAFATFGVYSNLPPLVQITSPSNMSVYLVGQDIPLAANASDPGGAVQAVEFYLLAGHDFMAMEQLVGTASATPYTNTLSGLGPGAYRVFARARDSGGLATDSDQRHIHVEGATGPRLEFMWMGQMLMLMWNDPAAVLETAEKLPGTWTAVNGARSPHHVMPTDPGRFFRLRLPSPMP
jgi:hypothetical protein